jgi:hypothetical protein
MSTQADVDPYHQVKLVLAGRLAPNTDRATRKIVYLVTRRPCDIRMAVGGPLVVQFLCTPTAQPHTYFAHLAPGLVYDLMCGLNLKVVSEPVVGILKPRKRGLPRWPLAAWLIPAEGEVIIRLRDVPEAPPIESMAVPEDGPWASPTPLPSPAPTALSAQKRWSMSSQHCPHCNRSPGRFRILTDAWICEVCGRSFVPPVLETD